MTAGGSVLRRLTASVVSEVVQASVDVEFNGYKDVIFIENSSKSIDQVMTETTIGVGGNITGVFSEASLKAITNSKATKELKIVNNQLKRAKTGSDGEATRLIKSSNLKSTIKGNNQVSEAIGIISTEIFDAGAKSKQK